MSAEDFKKYSPTDPELIDKIVNNIKAQGLFDQFRRDCLADVDTKPAYQNLKQRVNGSVTGFLSSQKWQGTLNKTQLRESLRKHTVQQGFLEVGVDRIVDQVVNPKIYSVFTPKVEDVVYECLGIEKPKPKPKPLLLDFQAFKKSLTPMKSASLKPEMTEDTQVPSVKETEEIPDVKVEPDEAKEPSKEIEIPSEMEKLPESTSTPPPLNDLEVSEPPQDIGPGTPPRVPEVNNDVNNDDDSNTIDEMPLIAASLDQDSNRATTPVNSLPHPNNIGADILSEASASQSIVVTRPRSEYDSSTNNLSLKSVDKISPSKKFDNFSNLGEKLKQSDMNLRETSASKNDIVTEESSELTKSSENDSESYETKVDPPSESNMSSLDNTRYEPIRDDGTSVDKIFSDDSSSSLVSTKSRSRADDVKESKIREKHSERKSTSSKSRDKSKPSRERDSSVDKDPNDKRDRHNSSKSSESKAKDEGKEKSKESKHKSDKHKSSKEKTSRSSDLQSKSELEKERKEKKDKGESDDKKSEKRKHESKVSENGKESDKKRKDDDRSHHNHEKNRKSDGKIKSEKDKKDKDKSKSEGKFKSDSASKSSHKSSDKYSKDEKRGKSEGSKKESKKRTREQCDEDDFKSKHSRRSSDRDSNGNADTGTNKNKSGGSLHSSRQSSKGDKGRKHSKKESNPSEAVEELHNEELVTDEIDLIMMQINNSIEDEQQRFNVRELLGEPNVKKPKIASNFQEIKKVMQARKHIDKINSEVNVDQLSDEEYLSQQDTENEPADADQVENVGLKKFSLVITDMLKKPDSRYLPSLKDKCLELDGKSAEKLTTGVSVILGEDDEILSVDQNESGTSESCTSPNSKESIIGRAELKKLTDEDIVVSGDARKFEVCSTRSRASESEELEAKSSASRRQTRSGSSKSESCKKGFEDSSRSTGNIARVDKSSESHMRSKSNPCIESGDTVDEEKADAHESEDASDKRISDSYNRHTRSRTSSAGSKDGETETNRDIRSAQSSLSNSPVPCRSSSRKNAGNRLHAILEEVGGPKFQTPLLEKAKRKAPKDEATERSGLVGQMSAIINPDDCSDVSNKENDEAKASGACKINNSKTEEVLPDASHNETRSMRRKPIDSSMRGTGEDMSKLSASTTRTTSRRSTVTPLNSRNETLSVTTPGSPEHEPERMADKVKNEGIRKSMECLQMDKENTLTPLSLESTSPSQVRNIASPNHRRKSCSDVFQRRVSLDQNEPPSSADDSTQGIVDITENEEIGGRLEPKVNLPNSPTDSSMVESNEAPVALGHRTRGKALKFDGPRFGRNVKRHAANESSLETQKPPLAKSTAELDTLVVDAIIQSSDQTEGRSEDSNMAAAQDPVSTEHEELTDHIECRTRAINKRRKSTVDEKKKRSVSQKNTGVTAILPDSNKDLNPTSSTENNSSSQSDDKTNTKEKMISGKKIEKSETQRSKKNRYPNATDELTSPQSSQLSPKKVGIGNISTSGLSCRKLQVSTEPQSPSVDSSMRASEFKPEMTYFSDDDLNDEINEDFRGFSDEQIHKAVVQLELLKKFISQSAFSQQPQTVDDKPKAKKTRVSSEQSLSTDLPAAIRTSSRIPRKRKLSLHTSPGKDKKNDLVGQCKAESKDSGLSESPEQPSFTLEEVPKITTTLRHSSGNNGQRTRKVPEPMVNGDSPKTMKQCHEKAKDEGITSIKKAVIGTRSSQRYSASDLYKPRPSFTRDSKNTPSPRITTVGRSKKSS